MKKTILSLLIGSIFSLGCRKGDFLLPEIKSKPCIEQKANPAGRSYTIESIANYTCTEKHCGILPLSSNNYWIYEDSIFNDGIFVSVQLDTLQYSTTKKTMDDGLVWWNGNINVGLPDLLYVNDSSFFSLNDRLFTPEIKDVKKEFGLFAGDSLRYLTSFEDAAALGRSLKLETPIETSAGSFDDYLYFEKNARNYRKDQVYFKPGIGVLKYIQEKAPIGQRVIKLQKISTLVDFYIE
ncbi:MAG: hypothetical protein ACRDEB_04830 [Chitinophagaceae bacterium]